VIGDSKRWHPETTGGTYQIGNATGSIEQTILGMIMKMNKFGLGHF